MWTPAIHGLGTILLVWHAGPNGCGKSTLIKALSGLHPLAAGTAHLLGAAAAEGGVLFIPQRPLAAPGSALWQQLCYPGGSGSDAGSSDGGSSDGGSSEQQGQQAKAVQRAPDAELAVLLERVGLQYLLARVGGSFEAPADWAAMLSPGELQRLAVARVLHRYVHIYLLCYVDWGKWLWEAAGPALPAGLHPPVLPGFA